jgi:type II secretory pathway component PulF
MLFEPQLSNQALTELCHRLAVETDAGIDIRRTWKREVEMARGRIRPYFIDVRDAVVKGDSLTTALSHTGRVLPPLFHEMAHVGEQTGTLAEVFHRLEAHYRRQVQAQRIFLGAIAWPMLELALAIIVIGILIWVLGAIGKRTGTTTDVLGFGLVGTSGLIIYTLVIAGVAAGIATIVVAVKRGNLWTRPLQNFLINLPGIGPAQQKIALARVAWVLQLTLNVEMDLRRVVPLVLRSTGSNYYTRHTDQIVADVAAGQPLHAAFARSGAFPVDFLDALTVAEESGQLVESMTRLSKRYEEEAEAAVKAIAVIMGFAVAALVMGIIVVLIFRLAGFYLGTINDALEMSR